MKPLTIAIFATIFLKRRWSTIVSAGARTVEIEQTQAEFLKPTPYLVDVFLGIHVIGVIFLSQVYVAETGFGDLTQLRRGISHTAPTEIVCYGHLHDILDAS